jgi:hypothetical protein
VVGHKIAFRILTRCYEAGLIAISPSGDISESGEELREDKLMQYPGFSLFQSISVIQLSYSKQLHSKSSKIFKMYRGLLFTIPFLLLATATPISGSTNSHPKQTTYTAKVMNTKSTLLARSNKISSTMTCHSQKVHPTKYHHITTDYPTQHFK